MTGSAAFPGQTEPPLSSCLAAPLSCSEQLKLAAAASRTPGSGRCRRAASLSRGASPPSRRMAAPWSEGPAPGNACAIKNKLYFLKEIQQTVRILSRRRPAPGQREIGNEAAAKGRGSGNPENHKRSGNRPPKGSGVAFFGDRFLFGKSAVLQPFLCAESAERPSRYFAQ